jgi:hypothetical protein
MNSSNETCPPIETALDVTDRPVVLVREAGLPFQAPLSSATGTDPFREWLSLMEVVQMLCPAWSVRDQPMQGQHWKI